MSLIQGLNPTTNKKNILNIDNDGALIISDKLRRLRARGKCYIMNAAGTTGTAGTSYHILTLFNSGNSGKTLYVYNTEMSLNGSGLTTAYFQLQIKTLSTLPTGGTSKTGKSLKLDEADASALGFQDASVSVDTQIYTTRQVNSNNANDLDFHENIQFHEEFIEIPAGYGVTLIGYRSASNNVYAYANIKFIEVDNTETI